MSRKSVETVALSGSTAKATSKALLDSEKDGQLVSGEQAESHEEMTTTSEQFSPPPLKRRKQSYRIDKQKNTRKRKFENHSPTHLRSSVHLQLQKRQAES